MRSGNRASAGRADAAAHLLPQIARRARARAADRREKSDTAPPPRRSLLRSSRAEPEGVIAAGKLAIGRQIITLECGPLAASPAGARPQPQRGPEAGIDVVVAERPFQRRERRLPGAVAGGDVLHLEPIVERRHRLR